MLAPTHSVFGIFLTLTILAVFGVQWGLHWTIIFFSVLGAIMPDIDYPRSVIGRLFYPISSRLERKFGHRTITHSFIGWAISSVIFAFLVLFGIFIFGFILKFEVGGLDLWPRWIAAFSLSYFSHLVLDMFNRRGSQMLWPDPSRDVIPRNPKYRPESGSKAEILIFLILLFLMFLSFPISKYGLASSIRWLLATPGAAIDEFASLKTHAYLDFKGYFEGTKQDVEGVGEILDVDHKRLVMLYKGNIYTLSNDLSADIIASKVRVKKTNVPIKIETREFKNETREYLLSQIPKGALVSGTVKLPAGLDVQFPAYAGSYKPLEQKDDNLIISFATKDQIKGLALTENFDLQKKKDQANLDQLVAQADKLKVQIKPVESGGGLTPLGRQMLLNKEERAKQQTQLAELKGQLDEINVKIEELKLKIKARKFVFSGEVYLRQ